MSDHTRLVRSQRAAALDVGSHVYLVARDGVVRRIEGEGAQLARAVLAFSTAPRTRAEIRAHVESLAGALGDGGRVVDELVDLLVATGALSTATGIPSARETPARGVNIVVAITGAIAATHAPALVAALQRRGHTVEVAMTETARRFVAIDALAAIAGRAIHTTLWPTAPHSPPPHIALAGWADLVVIYPVTATTLSRIACGDFSELVSALALTTRSPVVLVPSMNGEMAAAPAVQRNLEQLRDDGFWIALPVPSEEVADAPTIRLPRASTAAAPGEVAATVDALLASGALAKRRGPAVSGADWDAVYRAGSPSWVRDDCEPELAALLARYVAAGTRVLDVGCGLGQVARQAARCGAEVVATDVSALALELAREPRVSRITWLRDDICATNLVDPFDVIVDRAVLHTLPAARVHAWVAAMTRLTSSGSVVVIAAHRDGIPGVTSGWTARAILERVGADAFEIVSEQAFELPGIGDRAPIPSVLAVLRRK